jgi:hypothetical protein
MDIFQGKTSVTEVFRKYDLTSAIINEWIEKSYKGTENQLLDPFQRYRHYVRKEDEGGESCHCIGEYRFKKVRRSCRGKEK